MPSPKIATLDFSLNVGTTAVSVFTNGQLKAGLSFQRLCNVAASGGGTVWLSRSGSPAVVNGAGSFPLAPGQYEMFTLPQGIPTNSVSAIATAANTPLTVEVG